MVTVYRDIYNEDFIVFKRTEDILGWHVMEEEYNSQFRNIRRDYMDILVNRGPWELLE